MTTLNKTFQHSSQGKEDEQHCEGALYFILIVIFQLFVVNKG